MWQRTLILYVWMESDNRSQIKNLVHVESQGKPHLLCFELQCEQVIRPSTWGATHQQSAACCRHMLMLKSGHFCTAARHVLHHQWPVMVEGRGHHHCPAELMVLLKTPSHVWELCFPYVRNTSINQLSNTCRKCYSHIMNLTPFCQQY